MIVSDCDLASRDHVAKLIDGCGDHPLTAVIHADALHGDARIDGAWHLHELTADRDLAAFMLIAGVGGHLPGASAAGDAMASAFHSALAACRAVQGLPGMSLSYGPWRTGADPAVGAAGRYGPALRPLSSSAGVALFGLALGHDGPVLIAAQFDVAVVRSRLAEFPPIVRRTVQELASDVADPGPWHGLSGLSLAERDRVLLDEVRGTLARILGHPSGHSIEPDRPFTELGVDSLAGVELRKRLSALLGRPLPATLVFDYPTAQAVAMFLAAELSHDGQSSAADQAMGELAWLEAVLAAPGPDDGGVAGRVVLRLEALLRGWRDARMGRGASGARQAYRLSDR